MSCFGLHSTVADSNSSLVTLMNLHYLFGHPQWTFRPWHSFVCLQLFLRLLFSGWDQFGLLGQCSNRLKPFPVKTENKGSGWEEPFEWNCSSDNCNLRELWSIDFTPYQFSTRRLVVRFGWMNTPDSPSSDTNTSSVGSVSTSLAFFADIRFVGGCPLYMHDLYYMPECRVFQYQQHSPHPNSLSSSKLHRPTICCENHTISIVWIIGIGDQGPPYLFESSVKSILTNWDVKIGWKIQSFSRAVRFCFPWNSAKISWRMETVLRSSLTSIKSYSDTSNFFRVQPPLICVTLKVKAIRFISHVDFLGKDSRNTEWKLYNKAFTI
jgi:hypothetical protein